MTPLDIYFWRMACLAVTVICLTMAALKPQFRWLKGDMRIVRNKPPLKDAMFLTELALDVFVIAIQLFVVTDLPAGLRVFFIYCVVVQWLNHNCFYYDGGKRLREWRGWKREWEAAKIQSKEK
jgi:hypothetical protein